MLILRWFSLILLSFIFTQTALHGQNDVPGKEVNKASEFVITPENVSEGFYLPLTNWKYHAGDNIKWSQAEYDDSDWNNISPELKSNDLPSYLWEGTCWFRFNILVDTTLIGEPISLTVWQAGEAQIYLNGKLIHKFDRSNKHKNIPAVLTFDSRQEQLLAVRYSLGSLDKLHGVGWPAGFYIRLGDPDQLTVERIDYEKPLITYQIFFTTLSLAIGLLHLILFIFSPHLKQNLYFALYLFLYAAVIYIDYQQLLAADMSQSLYLLRTHRVLWPILLLLKLRFFYSLFYKGVRQQIWQFSIIGAGALFFSLLAVLNLSLSLELIDLIVMAIVVEISRVITMAVYYKKDGALIAGLAFLFFFGFLLLDYIMDAGVAVPLIEMKNPYAFGIVAFYLSMSVYLSRDFALTNKKVAEQEIEKKLLEADNKRQARELEEARQLQLSMLPEKLPEHPNFEIGVYMSTATEVGGDYYDFKLHDDGTLTVVIGDATGHGMQAGTMVSAAKSLFHTLADEPSPEQFLKKGSAVIKAMGMKKMFMAMTIVKLKNKKMEISAAGMPFPLIYRSSTGIVNEVVVKGMPLGGNTSYPYETEKVGLESGDTILLASDGFDELFDPQDEMLGTERVKKIFSETASSNPNEIITHLKKAGDEWSAEREQEDDITFVVIKVIDS